MLSFCSIWSAELLQMSAINGWIGTLRDPFAQTIRSRRMIGTGKQGGYSIVQQRIVNIGLGVIGAKVAKKVVENHDGSIWVRSEPGRGSTFAIYLPVK